MTGGGEGGGGRGGGQVLLIRLINVGLSATENGQNDAGYQTK